MAEARFRNWGLGFGVVGGRGTFRKADRLTHDREFQAVFGARVKKSDGPLTAFTLPSGLDRHRLGLSIGRRVGGAVRRGRLKRHLREAFRTSREAMPMHAGGGYDIVIASQKHEELTLEQYRELLTRLVSQCHRVWEKRGASRPPSAPTSTPLADQQDSGPRTQD